MTQREAERKLKKLAKGNYYTISIYKHFFSSKNVQRLVRVYIGNEYTAIASGEDKTFEEAFMKLEKELNGE